MSVPSFAAIAPGRLAVVTGAAGGIGMAAARAFADAGMRVVLVDRPGTALQDAAVSIDGATALPTDVADRAAMTDLARTVAERHGPVSVLMNNAGVGNNPGKPWEGLAAWKGLIDINFWGVVHGVCAFTERMLASGEPSFIINTGSKQGITTPPGNLAYNVSKSALKTYTEGLAHALRNMPGSQVSAHLLIPGFTYTGMTEGATDKPAGAWSGDEVVSFMLESLSRGDFYILCQDNETTRDMDQRRMAWAMGDIIENRPALSRWHPDYKDAFAATMKEE